MNVSEMSEQPVCVTPETDIVNAALTMADHELGALPVCEEGHLVGVITNRYIVFRYLVGSSHQGRLVAHYMTRDPVTIRPDDSLERAEALMSQCQIRRLPRLRAQTAGRDDRRARRGRLACVGLQKELPQAADGVAAALTWGSDGLTPVVGPGRGRVACDGGVSVLGLSGRSLVPTRWTNRSSSIWL